MVVHVNIYKNISAVIVFIIMKELTALGSVARLPGQSSGPVNC